MKARYDRTFEYGKKMAKYLIIFSLVVCVCSLLVPQGSYAQVIMVCATVVLMIATIIVMYRFCRRPYCGKRIMAGVLVAKSCPRCHRSLTTGKKVK